ncbi:MAG TPA: succinate dehydrogenase cytochrome b subunit [Dermatophilaceae bacterium]|nr:succinate dehydrogenase cytochrome b subunit [Dermatophilaceae bacterium]
MATQTLLKGDTTARRTTVFMKILMASTGALFVFYVLMHMYGNLKIFAGAKAFDEYAEHLREMLVPILPHSGFLWLFRILLVVALVVHAYAAFTLWSRASSARPQRYAVKSAAKGAARSKMMRWGGVTLLAWLIFHLVQFTIAKVNFNDAFSADKLKVDGHSSTGMLVIASFQLWWVVLIYLIALVALGMHLFHGVWSGAQTLGWTNSARSRTLAHTIAHLVAAVVVIGFAVPPLAILFGIVKG